MGGLMPTGKPFYTVFHSLRGGVGRTTATINVACRLALWGNSVLVLDFHWSAPGLSLLWEKDGANERLGLLDYVQAAIDSN